MNMACVWASEAAARQPSRPLNVGYHNKRRDGKCAAGFCFPVGLKIAQSMYLIFILEQMIRGKQSK